jgi:hypothetical protein
VARHDALHVYGVDLLTTADILSHFNTYGPTYVEWLNDSSCNVCFPDKFTVKRAIVQMGEALTDAEKEENRSGAMLFVGPRCERDTLQINQDLHLY